MFNKWKNTSVGTLRLNKMTDLSMNKYFKFIGFYGR